MTLEETKTKMLEFMDILVKKGVGINLAAQLSQAIVQEENQKKAFHRTDGKPCYVSDEPCTCSPKIG
jgi:hypothetical protein